jgi:hypothetical protein
MKKHLIILLVLFMLVSTSFLAGAFDDARSDNEERRGGDLNSCGASAPRAFQARAVPV